LTPEEEKYYETYFDTFASKGWKQFIAEVQEILDSHRIEDIKNETNLAFVKGERSALHRIARFEGGVKRTYDIIKEREGDK